MELGFGDVQWLNNRVLLLFLGSHYCCRFHDLCGILDPNFKTDQLRGRGRGWNVFGLSNEVVAKDKDGLLVACFTDRIFFKEKQ